MNADFFVLRTPLLPFDELIKWGAGLESFKYSLIESDLGVADAAWRRDMELLRRRLCRITELPEVKQALFIASESLYGGLEYWFSDPVGKKGAQTERALVRYFERMSVRATPFGLFSGCSVGGVSLETEAKSVLRLEARTRYRTASRLDFLSLFSLAEGLRQDPDIAASLRYRPNSSLHEVGGSVHYVESRRVGSRFTHHLVKVEADTYLREAICCAEGGGTPAELAEAFASRLNDADLSSDEIREYFGELIRNGVLVSDFNPAVTGSSPLDDMISQLECCANKPDVLPRLRTVRDELARLDRDGLGSTPERYRSITSMLKSLPGDVDTAYLYQVDMIKPVEEAALSSRVVDELLLGARVLVRIAGETAEPLRAFRESFVARYDRAMVPLLDALDEETGIAFGIPRPDRAPLIRDLPRERPGPASAGRGERGALQQLLLAGLLRSAASGEKEIRLNLGDLPPEPDSGRTLPDAFSVRGTLSAASEDALRDGDFEIWLQMAVPQGAQAMGRFCHADPDLEQRVRAHLRREERCNPDAIYAEIVYLPEGRIGNVLCRPVLREYELPYLGRSGAAPDRQIPVSDLLLCVDRGELVLYSRKMKRRVIPRMTNAHGFTDERLLAVYRFLCQLQFEKRSSCPPFSWGWLDVLDFLPRVTLSRLVLTLARWRLGRGELEELAKHKGSRQFFAVQELRRRRNLPKWVMFAQSDNTLPIDLDNPMSVDAFVHVAKREETAILQEMYPSPDRLCVTGPEGRFFHELQVPFSRIVEPGTSGDSENARLARRYALQAHRHLRSLPPTSEWLYVKIYGGQATLDEVLIETIPNLVRSAISRGAIQQWFFLRYADPEHHLRIRFHGTPERMACEFLPLLHEALDPVLNEGRIWKMQFDTYEREVERYGGLPGVILAEEIFHADSDAVLDILSNQDLNRDLDARWRIALLGADILLSDFGFDTEGKMTLSAFLRDSSLPQRRSEEVRKIIGNRFRVERQRLEMTLSPVTGEADQLRLPRQAFLRRSRRVTESVRKLAELAASGKLTASLSDLVASQIHMHINRIIRSSPNAHEMMLYDFLFRVHDGRLARGKKAETTPEPGQGAIPVAGR